MRHIKKIKNGYATLEIKIPQEFLPHLETHLQTQLIHLVGITHNGKPLLLHKNNNKELQKTLTGMLVLNTLAIVNGAPATAEGITNWYLQELEKARQ